MTLACRSISDGTKTNFITMVRKLGKLLQGWNLAKYAGSKCKTYRSWHLSRRRCHIGSSVLLIDQVNPISIFIYIGSRIMTIHLPASTERFPFKTGISIYLGKKLSGICEANSEHK